MRVARANLAASNGEARKGKQASGLLGLKEEAGGITG